jgi:hypothetical protein
VRAAGVPRLRVGLGWSSLRPCAGCWCCSCCVIVTRRVSEGRLSGTSYRSLSLTRRVGMGPRLVRRGAQSLANASGCDGPWLMRRGAQSLAYASGCDGPLANASGCAVPCLRVGLGFSGGTDSAFGNRAGFPTLSDDSDCGKTAFYPSLRNFYTVVTKR